MRTKLVRIGNSRGIRLPKAILNAVGLEDGVELQVEDGRLVITPTRRRPRPRAGWAEAVDAEHARNGPPETLDADWQSLPNAWDEEGWQW